MSTIPQTREQYSTHLPTLHLLCALGWLEDELYPRSPSGIDQMVREVSALALAEGLLAARGTALGPWHPKPSPLHSRQHSRHASAHASATLAAFSLRVQ